MLLPDISIILLPLKLMRSIYATQLSQGMLFMNLFLVSVKVKDILQLDPVENQLSISAENDILLAALLKKYHSQFGEFAPAADIRPVANTSCIYIDPLAPIHNKPLRKYNPGEHKEIRLQVRNML
jgi:hypothetical protein